MENKYENFSQGNLPVEFTEQRTPKLVEQVINQIVNLRNSIVYGSGEESDNARVEIDMNEIASFCYKEFNSRDLGSDLYWFLKVGMKDREDQTPQQFFGNFLSTNIENKEISYEQLLNLSEYLDKKINNFPKQSSWQ